MSYDYYGTCPVCHEQPVIANVGRKHFASCEDHAVYWFIGENLFSGWRDESPELWERNRAFLRACKCVEPYYLPNATREVLTAAKKRRSAERGGYE